MRHFRFLLIVLCVLICAVPLQAQEGNCDLDSIEGNLQAGLDAFSSADYGMSIAYLTCAIEIDNTFALAYGFRGAIYLLLGDYDEALSDLDISIELEPDFAEAYLARGWLHIVLGDSPPHDDFLHWVLLTETEAIEADLLEMSNVGNLPIDEGVVYYLTFEGTAGQVFGAAALADDGSDPLLILLDKKGAALTSDDDNGVNLDAVIEDYILPEDGQYTLILSQGGGYAQGEIELVINLNAEVQSTNPDNPDVTDSFAVYHLYIGETAEVFTTGGDRLNVRDNPGLDSPVLTQVAAGEHVSLLAGPVKADGYNWWQIRTPDGTEGWAVERVETEQTLQLALFPGEEAIVITGEDMLNVRDGAGRDFNVIYQLEDGAVVTLLNEEPIIRDNFRWWHIRDADGREGWAIDRIGIERVLVPAREFDI